MALGIFGCMISAILIPIFMDPMHLAHVIGLTASDNFQLMLETN
jgi:hypothetical protein